MPTRSAIAGLIVAVVIGSVSARGVVIVVVVTVTVVVAAAVAAATATEKSCHCDCGGDERACEWS